MYVPLRVHGHHSLLTGVDAPAALLARGAALGLPALALTDTDTLSGAVGFLQAAQRIERAPRPILGAELTDPSGAPGRVVALVESAAGYANLCRWISARQIEHEHFDLIDAAARWQEGLVLLVDHPRLAIALAGRVERERLHVAITPAALRMQSARGEARTPQPRNAAREVRRVHGPLSEERTEHDLEHPKTPPPAAPVSARDLIDAARAVELDLVAVLDSYAATRESAREHALRVAIKHNALLDDLPAEWLAREPLHIADPREFESWFASEPEWIRRTLAIAERCAYTPPLGGTIFPTIALAPGETPYSRLCALAFDGAQRRCRPLRPEILRRLDYELSTIEKLGFAPYFLLVKQIADFARSRSIPCVGRGSAADSLVAYCLELTDADPLRYRLTFERFLNPSRKDRPDIDLDFCWRRRDEVLEHIDALFGSDRCAMIATLNRCGVRAAFRESALVLGIPPAEVNRWSKRLPHHFSQSEGDFDGSESSVESEDAAEAANPLTLLLHAIPEASGFPFEDPRYRRALEHAARLIDTPRHLGLHPGGVVVAPREMREHAACHRAAKGVIATQYDKDAIEAIGLVKMDLLGNRALTVIDDCVRALRSRGVTVDWDSLPEDEPATARTLAQGRTIGCFQIESPGMRNLLQQIRARTMDDVIQAVALIRPGPASSGMKDAYIRRCHELEPPTPPHPRLTELLWDTHGVMLYQEDVMQAAALVAGMDLAEADLLRRALTKRKHADLPALRARFCDGARTQGIAPEEAERVWDLIANFASFGFCKAHAVTYGRLAWRTAWLKTHHPALFLAAFLASETGYYAPRVYVEEARRLGVRILPPDINRSAASFSAEWNSSGQAGLRIGLAQVKGLAQSSLDSLLRARAAHGAFVSLPDFLERVEIARDETASLIESGAMSALDRPIPELLWRLDLLTRPARALPRPKSGERLPKLDAAQYSACQRPLAGWGGKGLSLGKLPLESGGSHSLFPEPSTPALALPRLPEPTPQESGRAQFRVLGLSVELHPVRLFPAPADARLAGMQPKNPIACAEVPAFRGARVSLRGWPAATRHVRTAGGQAMRFVTLEDESGLAELVVFPDVYERDGARLAEAGVLVVTGVVEEQMGACHLRVERLW